MKNDASEKLSSLIEKLRKKVNNYFSKDASGHSIDHLERTLNYAKYLQSKEGGDLIVIGVSAFIHDIHRIMGAQEQRFVSPKKSLPIVEKFLKNLEITKQQKEHILYAIEHHEEYVFGTEGINVNDVESKILQDADNLDAIGAIGIARTIKYGVSHNVVDYDPEVPLYRNTYSEDYTNGKEEASVIHHIYNKLLRLGENMHTKTARRLAKKKTKLMKEFMEMFISEYTGEF